MNEALPGFKRINIGLASAIQDPFVNEAITTTTLSGITGSASGGMSIALAAMSETYLLQAEKFGISPEVLHRVASMAGGGMDTLPHNGAVITLLAITGLTHKQSYLDIFALTIINACRFPHHFSVLSYRYCNEHICSLPTDKTDQ